MVWVAAEPIALNSDEKILLGAKKNATLPKQKPISSPSMTISAVHSSFYPSLNVPGEPSNPEPAEPSIVTAAT